MSSAERWILQGEAVMTAARSRPASLAPPGSIRRLPGPVLVTASRYTSSPIGPFLELAVAEPVRLGRRLGWCRTLVVVDREEARTLGRLRWGFPAEVGRLRWASREGVRELTWDQRELVVRGRGHGPPVPWGLWQPVVQQPCDDPVAVRGRVRGLAQAAGVEIHAFPGDDLGPLAGKHVGLAVRGLQVVWRPGREPVGLALRPAPARVEPVHYQHAGAEP